MSALRGRTLARQGDRDPPLIRDRDSRYGEAFDRRVRELGVRLPNPTGRIIGRPVLGGLHHVYQHAAWWSDGVVAPHSRSQARVGAGAHEGRAPARADLQPPPHVRVHADQPGENIKYISTQLGHASVQITLDRYGHLFPDGKRTAASRLEAQLAAAVPSSGYPAERAGAPGNGKNSM